MALQKTLLKKRLKYRHPLPPKTYFCDKTIGSRELIFGTIPIKKCMNDLEFFQPNLRRSSGEMSLNWYVWRGMTHIWVCQHYVAAITSASSRCMHRLTIKLAAHFPYLTMIKHGLTWKWCTGIISQFLSLSFLCPWLLLSFWGHFRKVSLLSKFVRPLR